MQNDFSEVENPMPEYKNLPDGEYVIRGDKKGQRKEYWKCMGLWFLVSDVEKDNGHYYCDASTYELFPSLSEKEWKSIESVGWKRLNKVWQRNLSGYKQWMDIRKLQRNMQMDFMKDNYTRINQKK